MTIEHLYTTSEVADLLGVHRNTVRTMVKDGRLQAIKTKEGTGHLRFSKAAIDAYTEEHDLTRVSPKLIQQTHFLYAENDHDRDQMDAWLDDDEDIFYFDNLLSGLDPLHIFGSYLKMVSNDEYSTAMRGNTHKWIFGGLVDLFTNADNKSEMRRILSRMSVGLGSVDLGGYKKPMTATLIYHGKYKDLVLDGTLQQFIPELDKGIVVMERDVAESFYIKYRELDFDAYIAAVEGKESTVFNDMLKDVFESEIANDE